MPSVAAAVKADRTGYTDAQKPAITGVSREQLEPVFNAMLRCPLPPVQVTPDSLRQFYIGGQIPQTRLLTAPSNLTGGSSGGTIITNTTVVSTTKSGSTTPVSLAAKQASITSPALNPGDTFTGSLLMAKSFQLLLVSANSPCRVELYGTATAQSTDLSRGIDVAPPAGVFQNIISDVVLDTTPFQWPYQNRIAANGDSPQVSVIYITITNLDVMSDTITVTLGYVPLET